MPETGVEPVRNFVAADFKSATSTNSVIPAPKRVLRTLAEFFERINEKRKHAASSSFEIWSGRRVSNSRPQPWQGCALPTELLPHASCEGFELYTFFSAAQAPSSKKSKKYRKYGIATSFFRRFQPFPIGTKPSIRPHPDLLSSFLPSKPPDLRAHAFARASH